MKKLVYLFLALFVINSCDTNSTKEVELSANKIYFFFSETCPHCHHALEHINKKYPKLSMSINNISNPSNYELFLKCADKFKLGRRIGTPLFCMDDKYLMGWSPRHARRFDRLVKPFLKQDEHE